MSPAHSPARKNAARLSGGCFLGYSILAALLLGFLALPTHPASHRASSNSHQPERAGEAGTPLATAERSGVVPTRNGLKLRLNTDLGSVKIFTLEPGAEPVVRYLVHIETDSRSQQAQALLDKYSLTGKSVTDGVEIRGELPAQALKNSGGAQYWVRYEISIPASYSVEVNTGAGDIETQDIGGTATLITQGGNIRAGKIGAGLRNASDGRMAANLETEGGHIQVLEVNGDLRAATGGGHISIGTVTGNATLHTGGGHIRAGHIGGRADLETVGGNITVGQAESVVSVRTGGGQIDFGEVRGSVRAQTGGGGIRVIYVSGPMEVESSGGSICLTRVAGSVKAETGDGTITAWISPDTNPATGAVDLAGASQLASTAGDIVVYLPRNLAATIDATVEKGGERRFDIDPSLPISIETPANGAAGPVRAVAALNGGGPLLKLRTTAGRIRLQYVDSQVALRESLIRDQMARINRAVGVGMVQADFSPFTSKAAGAPQDMEVHEGEWFENIMGRLEMALSGGLREDTEQFRRRLNYSPAPPYPELARRAGIHGLVTLQVRLTGDGRVEVQKIVEGEPVLADAAIAAVKQWRGKAPWINRRPVDVISTVSFNFQLH